MERKTWRFHPIKIVTIPSEEISASIMCKVTGDLVSEIFHLNKIAKFGNRNIKIEQIVADDINSLIKLLRNGRYLAGIKSIEADDIMIYFNDKWIKVPNEAGGVNSKSIDFKNTHKICGILKGDQIKGALCTQEENDSWYLAFGFNNRYLAPLDGIKKFTLATYDSGLKNFISKS